MSGLLSMMTNKDLATELRRRSMPSVGTSYSSATSALLREAAARLDAALASGDAEPVAITKSCGCVYCDLDVPAFHMGTVQCTRAAAPAKEPPE